VRLHIDPISNFVQRLFRIPRNLRLQRSATAGELGADRIVVAATDGTGERSYSLPLAEGDKVRLFNRVNATFADTGRSSNIGQLEVRQILDDGLVMRSQSGKEGFVPWETLRDGR
jgi:hypothetical protein